MDQFLNNIWTENNYPAKVKRTHDETTTSKTNTAIIAKKSKEMI